jgi:spore germination protein KB
MKKEIISGKHFTSLLIMFIVGSSVIIGASSLAAQDAWIASILAIVASLPVYFIYARIVKLYPEKDLTQILCKLFGNITGKIVALLYVWYALHLGALVIMNFTKLIQVANFPETPLYIIGIFFVVTLIYIIKSGIEVMGRWASLFVILPILVILVTTLLGIGQFDFDNIKPIFGSGAKLIEASFSLFSFPFAEVVLFLMVLGSLNKKDSPYKVFYTGISIGGALLIIATLRNILILGVPTVALTIFPSYVAVSVIGVGEFFNRFEVLVGGVFLLCGFIKVAICLLAAVKGTAQIFNVSNYKVLVVPIALLMLGFSFVVYSSMAEMFNWLKIYSIYAFPFQVIFPAVIWGVAEIKHQIKKNG